MKKKYEEIEKTDNQIYKKNTRTLYIIKRNRESKIYVGYIDNMQIIIHQLHKYEEYGIPCQTEFYYIYCFYVYLMLPSVTKNRK